MKKLFIIFYLMFAGFAFGQTDTTLQADTLILVKDAGYRTDLTSQIDGLNIKRYGDWISVNAKDYIVRDMFDTLGYLRLGGSFTAERLADFPDASGTVVYNSPLYGGLGINQLPSAGQIPIGTGAGFSLAQIQGTSNQIIVTNSSGGIGLSLAEPISLNVISTSTINFPDAVINNPSATTIGIEDNLSLVGNIVAGGWNGSTVTVPYGGTGATTLTGLLIGNGTGAFTATTASSGIAGQISDETGSGALVFGTSPALTTPTLGVAGGTSISLTGSSGNTLIVETSGLVYDATNNRVGIGMASPLTDLHVIDMGFRRNGVEDNQLVFNLHTVAGAWKYTSTATGYLFHKDATALHLYTAPSGTANASATLTERVTFEVGGDVGIGDATPASLFTVGNGDDFQINSTGGIVSISTVATEGGFGVPAIIDSVMKTNQTATIGATNFTNASTAGGMYKVTYYLACMTASGTATVTIGVVATDGTARTQTSASVSMAANTNITSGTFMTGLSTGSVQWQTTVTGTISSAQYKIALVCERVF